jgi:hypothetical protein
MSEGSGTVLDEGRGQGEMKLSISRRGEGGSKVDEVSEVSEEKVEVKEEMRRDKREEERKEKEEKEAGSAPRSGGSR